MVEDEQKVSAERDLGVGPPRVIAELDLEHVVVEALDDGAHLAANETMFGHVDEQSHDIEDVDWGGLSHGKFQRT